MQVVLEHDAQAKVRAHLDVQALVTAISLDRVDQVKQHLRKRQRDHDEVHALGAQRDRADDQRQQG